MKAIFLVFFLVIAALLTYSCTSHAASSSTIKEVEYLQYVSGNSTFEDLVEGKVVQRKRMSANYAITVPESIAIDELYNQVDSVMCSLYSDSLEQFDLASYGFFRYTQITNNENLGKSKRQFESHSEMKDMLVSYEWTNGVFRARHEHLEGSVFPVNTTRNEWTYNCVDLE